MAQQALDLRTIRQQLEQERALLKGALDRGDSGKNLGVNPDKSDLALDYASRERRAVLSALEQERLTKIKMALYRLDNGTYGTCKLCRSPISPGRLSVLPTATRCIRCQVEKTH